MKLAFFVLATHDFVLFGKFSLCSCNVKIFKLYITEYIGLGLFIVALIGVIVYPKHISNVENCIYKDYVDCQQTYTDTHPKDNVCTEVIEVPNNLFGNVTLYYELPSFDQSVAAYAHSRDNIQLAGKLSLKPSPDCGNFTYDGNTPIAPCGAIADSFFNDTFGMHNGTDFLPILKTGLIAESIKAKYKNPAGDLKIALKDFAKPIHWGKNLSDLDPKKIDNNGFQNEAFIAWMETNMKRKPVWRLKRTGHYYNGLPMGNYTTRIEYNYPRSLYNGSRLIILCGDPSEKVTFTPFIEWIILAVIGITISCATRPVIHYLNYNKSDYVATSAHGDSSP